MKKNNLNIKFSKFEKIVFDKLKNNKNFLSEYINFLFSLSENSRRSLNENILGALELEKMSESAMIYLLKTKLIDNKSFERVYTITNKKLSRILSLLVDIEISTSKENNKENFKIVYSFLCPDCRVESILLNMNDENFSEEDTIVIECPHCHSKYEVSIGHDCIKKYKIPEVSPKIISYKEANLWNLVNPGTILYSFDEVHWQVADSDSSFWPDNVKFSKMES